MKPLAPMRPVDLPTPEPTIAAVARAPRGHVPELDALRSLAIWAVLAAHMLFTSPATPASAAFLPPAAVAILSHGWLGVDLFFVLSGFLITGILLKTKGAGRGAYFKRFYLRRVARILPLYFAVLVVLWLVFRGAYASYFGLCALMLGNFATVFNVRVPDAAGPYWSLAVEEQFYLIWPWLVLWLNEKLLARAALGVLLIEPLARFGIVGGHTLELMWYRADGLAMGAFLAVWFATWNGDLARARNLALGLAGIAVAITLAGIPFGILHEGAASTSLRLTQAVCIFGAALVVAVAYSGRPALAFMRSPATTLTALLSYCLYLIHKPLIDGFAWVFARTPLAERLQAEPTLLIRIACVLALAYAVAALSRRFLEIPAIRWGQRSEGRL